MLIYMLSYADSRRRRGISGGPSLYKGQMADGTSYYASTES